MNESTLTGQQADEYAEILAGVIPVERLARVDRRV
jgi:hypothetical protein